MSDFEDNAYADNDEELSIDEKKVLLLQNDYDNITEDIRKIYTGYEHVWENSLIPFLEVKDNPTFLNKLGNNGKTCFMKFMCKNNRQYNDLLIKQENIKKQLEKAKINLTINENN